MTYWTNLSMRSKLVTAFMLVALIPLILLAVINGQNARQALVADANQALFAVASQTAASLDFFITANLQAIEVESQLPVLVDYLSLSESERVGSPDTDEVLALLDTLSMKDASITSYALLDAAGIVVYDTVQMDVGIDTSDRNYFTHFQNSDDLSYVSPVQFSPETGSPALYFSSPVLDVTGEQIGLLRVRYNADVLQILLEEKNDLAGSGSFGVLFDDFHLHLAHGTAPSVNSIPIVRLSDEVTTQLKDEGRLPDLPDEEIFIMQLDDLEEHLSNPETQRFFEAEDIATGELINQVALAEMETQPWLVAFFQPQEIFLAPVEAQTRTTVAFSIFISFAALVVAFAVGQTLGQPLVKLAGTVEHFKQGDLSARSDIAANDEIGILAAGFNQMAEQVGILVTGLEEREAQFRGLLESAPDGIVIADETGKIVLVNSQIEKMFGYTREELIDRQIELLMPEYYQSAHIGHRETYNTSPYTRSMGFGLDLFGTRKNGEEFPAEISLSPLKNKDGMLITSIIRDITSRKAVEEAIRKSEARYRVTSELTSDYIYNLSVDESRNLHLVWATDAFTPLTGYTPDELSKRGGWTSLIHPEDQAYYAQMQEKLFATGEQDMAEYRIITKDGDVKWLRDHRRPDWSEEEGRLVSILGATYDDTIHKVSEQELKKLAAIVENSDDAILSVASDGTVLSWNPGAEQMFGYAAEEAVGKHLPDLIKSDDENLNVPSIFELISQRKGVSSLETLRVTKEGRKLDISATVSPIVDEKGEQVALSAIFRDISEQKKAAVELQQAKEAAETANRAKSTFLANMSHELRTPLNAILGFTQLIARDGAVPRGQQDNLNIIERSGEHLLALINDILELSKIEAGRTTLKQNDFDLHCLLTDMEDLFRLRAEEKRLHILVSWEPDVPQFVRADEGKLRQVFINLIGNAIKFTEQGGVSVRAGFKPGAAENRIFIEVEDTGPGIPAHELPTLFEAFIQSATHEKISEGTGLGLSISSQFVDMMGGKLSAKSEVGKGSIFRFSIPVQIATGAAVQPARNERKAVGLVPGQVLPRILIVEDRLENRKLMVRLLAPFGFDIQEAVNGQEAIEIWETWQPELIWMDNRMPVMTGLEATRHIKSADKSQHTKIIAITASAFEEDREMILAAGSDDFVRKPFRTEEIFAKMEEHLGLQFIYAEQVGAALAAGARDSRDQILPEKWAAIPVEFVEEMREAITEADFERIISILEKIEEIDSQIAAYLADLAEQFQYNEMLNVLKRNNY